MRYIGHSNFSGWQTAEAHYVAQTRGYAPFISAQNQYSLHRARASNANCMPACEQFGVSILPFFPLASGFLTGKYKKDQEKPEGARLSNPAMGRMADRIFSDHNYEVLEKLENFAQQRGKTRARCRRRLAGDEAVRRQRHRRRDEAGAGRGQRRRGRMAPHRRRDGRGRRHQPVARRARRCRRREGRRRCVRRYREAGPSRRS